MTQPDFFPRKPALSAVGRLDQMCKCRYAEGGKSDRSYWVNMEEKEKITLTYCLHSLQHQLQIRVKKYNFFKNQNINA